jgi:hypothetical protein
MKLEYLSAVLICLFLLCISVPNLFAQNLSVSAEIQNTSFENQSNGFSTTEKSDYENPTLLQDLRNKYFLNTANIAKYGFDVISVSDSYVSVDSIRLRTGLNNFSKNASAGIQLIVSW